MGIFRNATLVGFAILAGIPGFASPFTYTASGTAGDGRADNAKAVFTINAGTISIALTNTGGPGQVGGISSELDGITFTLTGGSPTTFTGLSGSAPGGGLDCSGGGATCTAVAVPASPFGWGLNGTAASLALEAGNGSLKPNAIVNDNVTGNTDGVSNGEHNPLLDGTVTFTFSFTGTAPTGLSNVVFEFGTGPDDQTGVLCTGDSCNAPPPPSVPEPSSVLLLGTAGLGIVMVMKRRFGSQKQS